MHADMHVEESMSVCLWYVYMQKRKNIEKTIKFSLSARNSFPGTNALKTICSFRLKMLSAEAHVPLGLFISSMVVCISSPIVQLGMELPLTFHGCNFFAE